MKTKTTTCLLKKALLITTISANFTVVTSQEEEKKWYNDFSISGTIDGYFKYNIDAPNQADDFDLDPETDDNFVSPATSFANQSGFALGMANLIFKYEGKKVGFVTDLVYGPRGMDAVFESTGSSNLINQLYVYWSPNEHTTYTFGNFNTFLGYEVISPAGNFNYSTSYMFSYGPFSHTGLKINLTLSERWSAMLAVMNPTDLTENNPFDTYIVGAQVGYSVDRGFTYFNFRYGNEGGLANQVSPTYQADITTGWNISKKIYLGANITYLSTEPQNNGDTSGFYGIAIYPQFKTSKKFTIGIRSEYFSEYNFAVEAVELDEKGDGHVFATTLTGSYEIGDLLIKPELRLDTTSENSFTNKNIEPSNSLLSFLLAAIYKF